MFPPYSLNSNNDRRRNFKKELDDEMNAAMLKSLLQSGLPAAENQLVFEKNMNKEPLIDIVSHYTEQEDDPLSEDNLNFELQQDNGKKHTIINRVKGMN